MKHTPTSSEKTILTVLGALIGLALLASMTSCTGTRPMSSCDYVRTHFGGYK